MRLHRFYIQQPLGEELVVEQKELVHQWIRVFRYSTGDRVLLFTAHTPGIDYEYIIQSIDKGAITLSRMGEKGTYVPKHDITLFFALVKKDTFETVVRQATELGITRIIPVLSARSEKKSLNYERLQTIATEASEQSVRGTVPTIEPIMSLNEAVKVCKGTTYVASLTGTPIGTHQPITGPLSVWIGPEGGWTEDEEKVFAQYAYTMCTLTPTVLKAETAVIALLSRLLIP